MIMPRIDWCVLIVMNVSYPNGSFVFFFNSLFLSLNHVLRLHIALSQILAVHMLGSGVVDVQLLGSILDVQI